MRIPVGAPGRFEWRSCTVLYYWRRLVTSGFQHCSCAVFYFFSNKCLARLAWLAEGSSSACAFFMCDAVLWRPVDLRVPLRVLDGVNGCVSDVEKSACDHLPLAAILDIWPFVAVVIFHLFCVFFSKRTIAHVGRPASADSLMCVRPAR